MKDISKKPQKTMNDLFVPEEVKDEFVARYVKDVGLGVDPDSVIQKILDESYVYVALRCGKFDIETNPTGKGLVFERARYARSNAAELFYEHFFSELAGFAWSLRVEVPDEPTQHYRE